MVTALDPELIVSFEELPISQVIHQEALAKLLAENGYSRKRILIKAIYVIIFLWRGTEVPPVEKTHEEENNSIGLIPSVM